MLLRNILKAIIRLYTVCFSFLCPAHNLTTLTNNNSKTIMFFKEDRT